MIFRIASIVAGGRLMTFARCFHRAQPRFEGITRTCSTKQQKETMMINVASLDLNSVPSNSVSHWLKRYYAARTAFSIVWVILAFTIGKSQPLVGAALLVIYPAWDCLANYVDATRNGGLRANPTQMLNVIVSLVVTLAVIVAVSHGFHAMVGVIGVWASLSGILQLSTGVRRWRNANAQWPQILSGAQSSLGGVVFLLKALHPISIGVADVAPYAAFGALYFAISAGVLAFKR